MANGFNIKKENNKKDLTGKESSKRYLEKINELNKKYSKTKVDWTNIWVKPCNNSTILDTYQNEVERLLTRVQEPKGPFDVNIFKQAAEQTAHVHQEEVRLNSNSLGIMPGSFNPIHFGHISTALASIYQSEISLDGVLLAVGGEVPDKPTIISFQHRSNMVKICLNSVNNWINFTPIRYDVGKKMDSTLHCFCDPYTKRSITDIAAFQLLFTMNPGISWNYITGSDKVNKYGKENERDLVEKILAPNNITVLFSERSNEPVNNQSINSRAWLKVLWEKGMFKKLDADYEGTSSTYLRKLIAEENQQIIEDIDVQVLSYIKRNGIVANYSQ